MSAIARVMKEFPGCICFQGMLTGIIFTSLWLVNPVFAGAGALAMVALCGFTVYNVR